ncbi:MAG TPA: adenylosuccinate lyase family protein [Xanthobacteraceae bacterium]|jgi:3-carboxy-cis,cis-muconate cycloisomerase|nr:adenylosuccinate lyase family protein [Xanthobacteraceae bacterium]
MAATALDSAIFCDIFSTPQMRQIFSDEARTAYCLEIEAALARAQARLRIIPEHAAREIVRQCRIENIDFARLKKQTERIGYPILGIVQQIVDLCADGLGEWCHWGATTQDITDTAAILQVRAALQLVEKEIDAIAGALADLSRRYRDTPMAGRSNLQQAVPLTFGFKTAALLAAMQRHRERLAQLRPRVLVGEFGGAVGTLASLGGDGLKLQAELMRELGLGQPDIAWHTVRDRIGEVACFLGLLTGTLGKVSMDVKLLMQTEVAEVYEPFHEGRGSSSTMPQKRNPISCLYIHATTALVRQQVAALLEAAVADHERSTGPWQIEWIALPEIFLLASGALAQTRLMLFGLEVDADRMRANLDLTRGTIVSEAVMMGLGPYLGRQRAHDLVYDICRKVAASGEPLVEVLARDGDVSRHLTRAQLEKMCDPAAYLGLAGEMVDKVLAREGRPMDR